MSVAEAWARRKRRRAIVIALATLALTAATTRWCLMPTWRKLAARGWPLVPARVEEIRKSYADPKEELIVGRRVALTFSYAGADGRRRTAEQTVSASWAGEHHISAEGYLAMANVGDPPPAFACRVNPLAPDVAVLETSLAHGDVEALFPLFVLLMGGGWVWMERRNARTSFDPAARTRARNDWGWNARVDAHALTVAPKPQATPDEAIVRLLVDWPPLTIGVAPHPVAFGATLTVHVSLPAKPRRARWLRVRAMCGPFNSSGSAGNARWSATLFEGKLAPGSRAAWPVAIPRRGDLPPSVEDCWLLVSARTRLGVRRSKAVWLAVAEGEGR